MQSSALQRLGEQNQIGGGLDSCIPTVEYVNRLGQRVSPSSGKPYSKPTDSSANGLAKSKSKSGKRRRRYAVKRAGSMFGNLEVIPTDATRDPPPRACFNCWQQGHSRRECPRPLVAHYCHNCGRRGEDLRTCPRCSRAHNEYLLRLQTLERGEEIEPEEVVDESLFAGERDANDDPSDEVLRELLYQDDRSRELHRSSYSQEDYKLASVFHDQRRSEQSSYRDREEDKYIKREFNARNNYYDRRQNEEERDSFKRSRSNSRQRDREYYKEMRECEEDGYYRGGERERDYEARASRSDNRNGGSEWRKVTNTFDDVDLDVDPVQEVLQLAKSIAHLTPDTQDLIMRQVMAERKERIRLRTIKSQERRADVRS